MNQSAAMGNDVPEKLDVVITMGGLGSRFLKAGYKLPKYMIPAKGKTLFEWSMISLEGFRERVEQYIFIALKNDELDVREFVEKECEHLKIRNYQIILLDRLTDGQATTAVMAKQYWHRDNGLLIYNIDTYVEAGEMKYSDLKGDGFIPCFRAEGDHWSFVRTDENGEVVEIKEKQRISDQCTLGAYYFRSCEFYQQLYEEYYGVPRELVNGEKYVAPLYDYLLSKGGKIYISEVPARAVNVLGTPEELSAFLHQEE